MSEHTPLDLVSRNADAPAPDPALTAPPALRLAVLTCMDARVLPAAALRLGPGDAHVVRNAGGRASEDAIRSVAVSTRLLGVRQVAVIHHTDCGNAGTDEGLAAKLVDTGLQSPPQPLLANGPDALEEDVAALRDSPLLAPGTMVEGFVYDVRTGRLHLRS